MEVLPWTLSHRFEAEASPRILIFKKERLNAMDLMDNAGKNLCPNTIGALNCLSWVKSALFSPALSLPAVTWISQCVNQKQSDGENVSYI